MAGRFYLPRSTAFDANGDPISGAKLEFFESGTTTPLDTFSDDALTVANANPVIADSAGRFGDIFLQQADYKVTLSDADDNVIWTSDPVRADSPKSSDVREVTTTTVLDTSDDGKLITADATSGAFIITLPAAATAANGYEVTVQKIDSSTNIVTVDASGAETINGVADLDLPDQYAAATFRCDGTEWYASAITPTTESRILDPGFITGYTLTNNGTDTEHDIDVAAGTARSDDDTGNVILTSAITKQIDAAFAEGTNQGGLDTGTVAADTVYHIFAISKADGTADALFSLSKTTPTLPSGFTLQKRIGTIATDSSSNIINDAFVQVNSRGEDTRTEVTTTSGTSVAVATLLQDDVIEAYLTVQGVGTDTSSQPPIFQIGPTGGVVTTNYVGIVTIITGTTANETAVTDGFYCFRPPQLSNTENVNGIMELKRHIPDSNTWLASGRFTDGAGVDFSGFSGFITSANLGGALALIDVTTPGGTAAFDEGTISLYAKNYQ